MSNNSNTNNNMAASSNQPMVKTPSLNLETILDHEDS